MIEGKTLLILLYKNKGDIQLCINYHGTIIEKKVIGRII